MGDRETHPWPLRGGEPAPTPGPSREELALFEVLVFDLDPFDGETNGDGTIRQAQAQ
jgi:hypothetical protein